MRFHYVVACKLTAFCAFGSDFTVTAVHIGFKLEKCILCVRLSFLLMYDCSYVGSYGMFYWYARAIFKFNVSVGSRPTLFWPGTGRNAFADLGAAVPHTGY